MNRDDCVKMGTREDLQDGVWSNVYLFHHQGSPLGRVFGIRDGVRAAHHQEVDGQ